MPHPSRFCPRKEKRYPMHTRLGGPNGQCGWVQKNVAPTNIQSPDHPTCSESLCQLGYSHPQLEVICAKTDYRQIFFTLITTRKYFPILRFLFAFNIQTHEPVQ